MLNLTLIVLFVSVFYGNQAYKLPESFEFGVASSAHQVEGAWNESGKGENIWDRFTHFEPHRIADHSNADVTCDSYHRWRDDIQMLKDLGVDYYRFSISWSRILPTGFVNVINPNGVRYYNELINALLENNIKPMVTIFHWDLPTALQELGGATNPEFVNFFTDYARYVFELFGDRVKIWIPLNEPNVICEESYEYGRLPPALQPNGIAVYICGKVLLLAHASVYHLYNNVYRKKQGGTVGFNLVLLGYEPETNSSEDMEAVTRAVDMNVGWMLNPIFTKEGDYPESMKRRIDYLSRKQNFSRSRLPAFTEEEKKNIVGTADFLAINYYTSIAVESNLMNPYNPSSVDQDKAFKSHTITNGEDTILPFVKVLPRGLGKTLSLIKEKYGNPPVYISENGFPDNGTLNDDRRINYIQRHLVEVIKAIEKGANVLGYTYWSLMDSFEFNKGYTVKYGLYSVDFRSSNKTRTAKKSADYYKELIKSHLVFGTNWREEEPSI